MERGKSLFILVASVVLALVATLVTYNWLKKKAKLPAVQVQQVVAADQDLAPGTIISKEKIKLIQVPIQQRPAGSFSDTASLEGRTLVQPVKAGEPILETKVSPAIFKTGGISGMISPNKRAVAVKVDKVAGVAGFIHPGSRVDVLVTLREQGNRAGPVSKTVLCNIPVLAAGTKIQNLDTKDKPVEVDVITLEVTPEEGEKVALAANEGKLQLTLRNFSDAEASLTRGTTVPVLLASYKAPITEKPKPKRKRPAQPAKTAPVPQVLTPPPVVPVTVIQVIKGSKVDDIRF